MNTGMAECLMVTMMCIGSINAESQKMFAVGFAKPLDNHEFTGSFLKVRIKQNSDLAVSSHVYHSCILIILISNS